MKEYAGRNILLVVENNSVPFDKRVWREALALKELGANVIIVCPICDKKELKNEILEDITIHRFSLSFSDGSKKGYLLEYLNAFIKIFWLINKINFNYKRLDIAHFANPPDIFWPIGVYLRLLGIKFIYDEHDLTPETYLSKYRGQNARKSMFYRILKLCEYLSYKFATTIIATNESYKEHAEQMYPKSLSKIFIVRNGPDTRNFHITSNSPTLKRNRTYLFAYIGIMGVQDGVDYIINSTYYLVNYLKFKDFIIYLIGSGDDTHRLKELTRIYDLDEYIIFTGRISDTQALEILSTADICLSPDPFNPLNDKSTMNKVMEYMALGKPIVSFNLKEAKYSAQNSAVYVDNNDIVAFAKGIIKLINNPELGAKMAEEGKDRAYEALCWQKQIENLIKAYRYTLNK